MSTDKTPIDDYKTVSFEPLLKTSDAAELLGVHPKTLEKWARKGIINGSKIGREWKFRASLLDDFVRPRYTHRTVRAA